MRKNWWLLLLIILVLTLFSQSVLGAAIGVNKAVINYENVLRGGYAQDSIFISTDLTTDVGIEANVSGVIADWISFGEEQVVVRGDTPGQLTVIVQPPADTPSGNYQGELRLITTPIAESSSGRFGTAIRTSFRIKIEVLVTGDEVIGCTAGGFSIPDSEIAFPLDFKATIQNDGNVRLDPDFEVDIWDQSQERLLYSRQFEIPAQILPTTNEVLNFELDDVNLDTGQYWADIKAPTCGQDSLITFSVVQKGDIIDQGELISLTNPLWVKIGDIVPIKATFKNTGERFETVKLKGTVKLADQIIKVIDTDELDVAPGEVVDIETFFNPKMAGQYVISARVLYNNKLTFWKNSILNALPSDEFEARLKQQRIKAWTEIFIMIIIIAIIVMLILIKRKKKKVRKVKFNF